ncbi:hypothetical protein [Lysinibacillus xylanilyticus]|uniref:hypothetical protein n=1 Tax=Lysinibacillus xylanilyticus TaxID=582475 RepID=UPI003803C7BE
MGLGQSMSRRGNCWDNAPQESFLGFFSASVTILAFVLPENALNTKTPVPIRSINLSFKGIFNLFSSALTFTRVC